MKTFVTILSALALMGAVSAASAAPASDEIGTRAFWEQTTDNG
jgi:hypothetical protein